MPGRVFYKADDKIYGVMRDVMSKYHPEKHTKGVRVAIRMIDPPTNEHGEAKDAAIYLHGHRATATIRLVRLKDRIYCPFEAIMDIDAFAWKEMPKKTQIALIDHELTHLELVRRDNAVVMDDDGRPKISMRRDDWCLTGFASVAMRHGLHSIEYQSFNYLEKRHQQGWFAWAGEGADPDEVDSQDDDDDPEDADGQPIAAMKPAPKAGNLKFPTGKK